MKTRPALHALIAAAFARHDAAALCERLLKAGVAFARVNGVAEFSRHPQLRRVTVQTPNGDVALPAPPPRIAGSDVALGPVPAIGEHSEKIRREFATDTLDHLKDWIGRTEARDDVVAADRVRALAATLELEVSPKPGEPLPPGWHWMFFNPAVRAS